MIDILVPTFRRPHSLQRVADNVHANTTVPHTLTFIVEDQQDYRAARKTGERVILNRGEPCFSNALQEGYEATSSEFFLPANDDFDFQPDWDTEALKAMTPGIHAVGINDDSGQGDCYEKIALVRRSYIEEMSGVIGMTNRVFFPYRHNYVDNEFYRTAVFRGVFAKSGSVIKHRHPDWGHAEQDDTYRKGQSTMGLDATTFASRTHLWQT